MFSCLLTGAGGLIAGHLAEVLVERGCTVSALSRPESDTAFLEGLGVQVQRGDLANVGLLRRLAADAEVVIHCAAKRDGWGPLEEFRRVNVEGTRALLAACKLSATIHSIAHQKKTPSPTLPHQNILIRFRLNQRAAKRLQHLPL